jgi:Flp pilus assembly protein TadG
VITKLALSHRLRRGLAIVEMALALILLMLILLGVLEYGWLFVRYQQVRNTARHGARVGVTQQATLGDVDAAVKLMMTQAKIADFTATYPDPGLTLAGTPYTVTVTVNTADVDLSDFKLFPKPAQMTCSVTMRKEGVP